MVKIINGKMKLYKVWIELEQSIYAESEEKAEEYFSDNLDLSKAIINSCLENEDENYCGNPSCLIKNCDGKHNGK